MPPSIFFVSTLLVQRPRKDLLALLRSTHCLSRKLIESTAFVRAGERAKV